MIEFHSFELSCHAAVEFRDNGLPTTVTPWGEGERPLNLSGDATHFGIVFEGSTQLSGEWGSFRLAAGMYFAAPGPVEVRSGRGLTITAEGYRGFFQVGGPIEETGRLRYIDGCTDSLLVPPVMLGDPCLNLLHIPPGTRQTAHTHPSIRVGLIVRGSGECVTPGERFPLRPGLAFVIPEGTLHSFHTTTDSLLVIAYHPDTDFGPTHESHPMINRTIVPGRSQTAEGLRS